MKPYITVSTVADGSMRHGDRVDDKIQANRRQFLRKHSTTLAKTVLLQISYSTDDFVKYQSITLAEAGDGMIRQSTIDADGLVTTEPGLTMFLPLADCVGAVIFDSRQSVVMLSHLGRHNLEQNGGQRLVEYLIQTYNSQPADLAIYLSPAASGQYYPLHAFNDRSLHKVTCDQLQISGVQKKNITIDQRDTVTSDEFYSHSAFLRGEKPTDDRFAIICRIIE
jgi:copper oxidase (laccase) domain-containing protein